MNTLALLLHLLLHTFLLLTSALPTPNPQSQSKSQSQPAEPKTLCTTTAQSPTTSLVTEAITLYTGSCSAPASVPTSQACIALAESADSGYYISLCGWRAAFADCAGAGAAVEALVEACAEGGRAEGQISGEWGTVVVGRVVGKTGST